MSRNDAYLFLQFRVTYVALMPKFSCEPPTHTFFSLAIGCANRFVKLIAFFLVYILVGVLLVSTRGPPVSCCVKWKKKKELRSLLTDR